MASKNQQENTESSELAGVQRNEQKSTKGWKRTLALTITTSLAALTIMAGGLRIAYHFSNNYYDKARNLKEKTPDLKRTYDIEKEIMRTINSPHQGYVADRKLLLGKVFENSSSENFYRNLIKEYNSLMSQGKIQEGRQMVADYEGKGMSRWVLGICLTTPSAVFIPMALIGKKKKSKK